MPQNIQGPRLPIHMVSVPVCFGALVPRIFPFTRQKWKVPGRNIFGTGAKFKRVPCLKSCRVNRALDENPIKVRLGSKRDTYERNADIRVLITCGQISDFAFFAECIIHFQSKRTLTVFIESLVDNHKKMAHTQQFHYLFGK